MLWLVLRGKFFVWQKSLGSFNEFEGTTFQPGLTLQLLNMFELSIDGALVRPVL